MKTLVIGGTGTIGSHVVQELLKRDVAVRVLTRDATKIPSLPPGVEGVTGDLGRPATVRSIFDDIQTVFLINTVTPSETHEGLMAVCGARLAHVERIVYLSVHNPEEAPYLPHFGAKLPIEIAVKDSGIDYTILRPNNFYQNDFWFREGLLDHGVYAQPIGSVGLSRVDVRDIAEAAARALTTRDLDGETINLVGPEALTAERTTEIWSRALGREISYLGDLDTWEEMFLPYMPDWLVFDYRLMYHFFQTEGLMATDEDLVRMARVLGHPPRRYEDYVTEQAAAWRVGQEMVAG